MCNILNWARFLRSSPMKLWFLSDVPLPRGAGLWERGWPFTMSFSTAESRGGMMLALCFWMFPALGRKFFWETVAKCTRDLCRRHMEGWQWRRNGRDGRETFGCAGMWVRAIAQARAEALCLPRGSISHPRARKLLPSLIITSYTWPAKSIHEEGWSGYILHQLLYACQKQALVLCWLPVCVNKIQWKRLLSKGRVSRRGLRDREKWMAPLPCCPARCGLHSTAGIPPNAITDHESHIFHLPTTTKICYFLFEIIGNSARINSLILFEQVWFYILSVCFVLHYKPP